MSCRLVLNFSELALIAWITPKAFSSAFRAIELFFSSFTLPTSAAFTFLSRSERPSRTNIERYQNLLDEVAVQAERINARFQAGRWKPIVLLKRHHSHERNRAVLSRLLPYVW